MYAITIRQPWAALIAMGACDVLNTCWLKCQPGQVLIHASKSTYSKFRFVYELDKMGVWPYIEETYGGRGYLLELLDRLAETKDAIIGAVEVVKFAPNTKSPWAKRFEGVSEHWELDHATMLRKPLDAGLKPRPNALWAYPLSYPDYLKLEQVNYSLIH